MGPSMDDLFTPIKNSRWGEDVAIAALVGCRYEGEEYSEEVATHLAKVSCHFVFKYMILIIIIWSVTKMDTHNYVTSVTWCGGTGEHGL